VPARVRVEDGKPARVSTDRRGLGGGRVVMCAGPWRTAGGWWVEAQAAHVTNGVASWDRDEWDVSLPDGTYRLFRDRRRERGFIDGVVD
jgi:hypothetical protein